MIECKNKKEIEEEIEEDIENKFVFEIEFLKEKFKNITLNSYEQTNILVNRISNLMTIKYFIFKDFKLMYKNNILDIDKTLEENGLVKNNIITVILEIKLNIEFYEIFEEINKVSIVESILSVKKHLERKFKIEIENQILVNYDDIELENNKKLCHYLTVFKIF